MGNLHCCENKTLNDKAIETGDGLSTPIQSVR